MSNVTNAGKLVRLDLRRDRIILPIWLVILVGLAVASAVAVIGLYPTTASRVLAASATNSTPSLVALYGWIYDPTSLGSLALLKIAGPYSALVAVLAIVVTNRHTRADEEAGRLELIGSTVVGRHASLVAALATMIGSGIILGLCTGLGLAAGGLPVAGSFAFGASWTSIIIVFSVITAFFGQLTQSSRTATGLSVLVLAIAFVLRAVGDAAGHDRQPTFLSWLSPIGWAQQVRPYAGDRWWVLLLPLGLALVVAGATFAVAARRDLGAGVFADHPGPARASTLLRSTLALAWRLQRAGVVLWAGGFLLMGLVFGASTHGIVKMLQNPGMQSIIRSLGGVQGLTDAFLVAVLGIVAMIATVFGIQSASLLRAEESSLHAEPILATQVSRIRWATSHVVLALAGSAALMVAAGLGMGISYAADTHDAANVGVMVLASIAQIPAIWVLLCLTIALIGVAPRLMPTAWAVFIGVILLGEIGPLFKAPQWVLDVSPYADSPRLPGGHVDLASLLVLLVIAAALAAIGIVGIRRRDLLI